MSALQKTADDSVTTWPDGTVVDFDSIERFTEEARAVAHPLDTSTVRTPEWVVQSLLEVSIWHARMPLVTAAAEEMKKKAARELQDAKDDAVLSTAGFPVREQGSRVRIATREQRKAYDRAMVAFEKSRRVGNLLSDYTSRLQTMAKHVELTYRIGASS